VHGVKQLINHNPWLISGPLNVKSKWLKVSRRGRDPGGMAEWSMAAVLKTVSPKGDVGSNPTPSAMHHVGCMAALNPTWFRAPKK
jgi:hypothetical protein